MSETALALTTAAVGLLGLLASITLARTLSQEDLGLFVLVTLAGGLLGVTLLLGRFAGVGREQALAIVFGSQLSRLPILIVWLVGASPSSMTSQG